MVVVVVAAVVVGVGAAVEVAVGVAVEEAEAVFGTLQWRPTHHQLLLGAPRATFLLSLAT